MARTVTTSEWGRIFANAWIDAAFADQLSTDPTAAVKSFLGIDAGEKVNILDVPPRPADLSSAQLEDVRSGSSDSLIFHAMPFSC